MAGSRADLPPPLRPERRAWRARRKAWRRQTRLAVTGLVFVVALGGAWWLRASDGAPTRATEGEGSVTGRLLHAGLAPLAMLNSRARADAEAPASPHPPPPSPAWPTPINMLQGENAHSPEGLRRLTTDGCCAAAWWAPDSASVAYLDRPPGAPVVGIYEVLLWPPGIAPRVAALDDVGVGIAGRYRVKRDEDQVAALDSETGREVPLAAGPQPVRVAPDGSAAVWWNARGDRGHYDAAVTVSAQGLEGGEARELLTMWGASVVDFLAGRGEVVVMGRPIRNRADFVLAAVNTTTGAVRQLGKGKWLSDAIVSPSGDWVAYMVSLDSEHPEANGLWLVSTAGGEPVRLPFTGSYRWRDGQRLVYIPAVTDAPYDEVWEFDAGTGATGRLLDPAAAPIRVGGNDWSVAPDGSHLVFRSATDGNLWVTGLP